MNDRTMPTSHDPSAPWRWRAGLLAAAWVALAAAPAHAYVGPGAGLSLLGALWGIVAAVVVALSFIVIWPVRRMIARRNGRARSAAVSQSEASATPDR